MGQAMSELLLREGTIRAMLPEHGRRISILTPSYNQVEYIEQNIRSVIRQDYPNSEHIVIDGGSTDGTLAILKKYPHLRWISERDRGQADALNKGLAMATGEIVGWINSDDYYADNIFHDVAREFASADVHWVVGNITILLEETGEKLAQRSPAPTYENLIKNPGIVRQQATFFCKNTVEDVGGWNPDLYMVMDYDLWLRLAKKLPPKMVDTNWAYYRIHRDQKTSRRNILREAREIDRILSTEGVSSARRRQFMIKKHIYALKAMIKEVLVESGVIDADYRNMPLSMRRELRAQGGTRCR